MKTKRTLPGLIRDFRLFAALLLPLMLFSSCGIDVSGLVPDTGGASRDTSPSTADETSSEFPLAVVSPSRPNQTFGVGYTPEDVLDPFETRSALNQQLAHLLYDSLYVIDGDGTVVSGICASLRSEDQTEYVLTILPGLTFHNGDRLTVQDVVYSLNRARRSSLYKRQLAPIADASADTASGELTLRLSRPLGSLPALLDFPIVSSNASADYGYSRYALLGSGRYTIDRDVLEETEYTYLEYNPSWYGYGGHAPALPRIDLFTVTDKEDLLRRYFNSDVDILSLSSSINDPIVLHGDAERREVTGSNLFFLGFNTVYESFSSAAARRGVELLIDREKLMEEIGADLFLPAEYPVRAESRVAGYLARRSSGEKPEGEGADSPFALLRSAGFSDAGQFITFSGGEYTVTLLYSSESDVCVKIAGFVHAALEEAGFRVEDKPCVYDDYIKALYAGSYTMYIGSTRPAENYDYSYLIENGELFASLFRDVTGGEAGAKTGGVSQETGEYLEAIRKLDSFDPLYFLDLAGELQELFDKECPFVPLCFDRDTIYLRGSFVSNVSATGRDIFFNVDSWVSPN